MEVAVKRQPLVKRATLKQALKMLIPFAGIFIAYAVHMIVPNVYVYPQGYAPKYYGPFLLGCAGVWAVLWVISLFLVPLRKKALQFSYLLAVVFLCIEVWDIASMKLGYLRMPYGPAPDRVLMQLVSNSSKLVDATLASVLMLTEGMIIGLIVGFVSGVLVGCSRIADYWLSPLLKIIGPIPGLVWLPVFMQMFTSSHIASIGAIVIAIWFPMTLMLSSAIRNTPIEYIERAEVLGASKLYIAFKVMIPNAIPALADALFMAVAGSFGALAAAEMCGTRSGLSLGVSTYGAIASFDVVYAYVVVMIILFAVLAAIMFAIRNWMLRWQRGIVKW